MTPSTRDALVLLASVTSDRDVVDDCRRAVRGDVFALRRVAPVLLRGGESMTRQFCAQWFMTFLVASDSTPNLVYEIRFDQGLGPQCSCPSYARSAAYARCRSGWIASCKHVVRVMVHGCLWNEHVYSGGSRTIAPAPGTLRELDTTSTPCPKCGGPCVAVDTTRLTR